MKKRRNCWLSGLLRSAVIMALVSAPILIGKGLPEPPTPYLLTMAVTLGVGTLIFGGIELYYERKKDKKQA
ncbi:MAG: hypothetical protein RR199_03515 [Alistipes sp.]